MKTKILALITLLATPVLAAEPREIKLHTEKVGEVMHWMPEKVEVHPGETVKIIASHDAPGGFEFHGLKIDSLNIAQQVNRGKPVEVVATIPADMKAGEYPIGCQFHPKHAAATLLVTVAAAKPKSLKKK